MNCNNANLINKIKKQAESRPDKIACTFLEFSEEHSITYSELYVRMLGCGSALLFFGLEPGDRVGIIMPSGLEFLTVFFGAMAAGLVPVVLEPPFMPGKIKFYINEKRAAIELLGVTAIIATDRLIKISEKIKADLPGLKHLFNAKEVINYKADRFDRFTLPVPEPQLEKVAMLQLSSGSTGARKGVILTHKNLSANLSSVQQALEITGNDVIISWLPLYHDMGLIGCVSQAFFTGAHLVLMSPATIMTSPRFWLNAIDKKKGTISVSPNFGYQLCIDRIRNVSPGELDLSSWRAALNGSEMIYPRTITNFVEKFAPWGFKKETFIPVYGLAEATLAVTFNPLYQGAEFDLVDPEALADKGVAMPACDHRQGVAYVSSGKIIPGVEVKLVDDAGQEVAERVQGRLLIRSDSVMQGYYNNPEATGRLLQGGWFDTQDLAYRADDHFFITGRIKDVIIRAGKNYNPEQIEYPVWNIPGIRQGSVAAFGAFSPRLGTESLVIIAETTKKEIPDKQAFLKSIRHAVAEQVGIAPDKILLVPPKTIPKTSSGKIRRYLCRTNYLKGIFGFSQSLS